MLLNHVRLPPPHPRFRTQHTVSGGREEKWEDSTTKAGGNVHSLPWPAKLFPTSFPGPRAQIGKPFSQLRRELRSPCHLLHGQNPEPRVLAGPISPGDRSARNNEGD